MSFPTNLQPASQQVTGHETVDTSQTLADYIQQQQSLQGQQAAQQPAPLSFQDPLTGQTVVVKDGAEMKDYLDKIISSASAVFEEKDRLLREAQQRAQATQVQQQAPGQPEPFSKQKYHDLLLEDPMAAADYLEAAHKPRAAQLAEQAYQAAQQVQQFQQNLYRQQLNEQFKQRVPEFPWQDQRALQAVNTIQQQLGLPPTVDAYEAAYELAKKRGMIQVPQTSRYSDPRQNVLPFPQQEDRAGIPMVPIGGQPLEPSEQAQLAAFMNMTQEQRDDYVNRVALPTMLGLRGA